jgi:hypothetical protein
MLFTLCHERLLQLPGSGNHRCLGLHFGIMTPVFVSSILFVYRWTKWIRYVKPFATDVWIEAIYIVSQKSWLGLTWLDCWNETRQTHETGGTGDSWGEGARASSCARNVSQVKLTRRVIYTRWRRFKGKCSVFCGLQNLNLWLKCDVSTVVCLMKNHHTKILFVVGIESWKRREA